MIEDEELWNEFVRTRAPELREELILKYLKLVRPVLYHDVKVSRQGDFIPEDLFQEGVVGLIQAVDRFDPSRGFKFVTYARWRIRGQIVDALRKASLIKRPLRRDLERFRDLFAHSPGVTDEEVIQALGVTPRRLRELRRYRQATVFSLDAPVLPDSEDTWTDFLKDPSKNPEEIYAGKELQDEIRRALAALSVRSRLIFGLYFIEGYTMLEIAPIVGVSESRVSQIVAEGLRLLQARLRGREIHGP